MKRRSSEAVGVAGGLGAITLVAVCCALPVFAPVGLVIGAGVAATAALSRFKRHRKNQRTVRFVPDAKSRS